MAISFPTAPIVGQVYEYGDYRYTWDGTKWTSVIKYGSSAVKIQSATPPGAPEPGLQWFDDDSGLTYIWHVNEGTSQGQWVEDAPQGVVDGIATELGGTNLLSNHNFIIASPDAITHPSATPTDYAAGTQIFSGVFANETTGITGLTYIDGRVSFSSGDFYMAVPNIGAIERVVDFVASVADFDGSPRTLGVSFALIGSEYRVTVGVDALGAGATSLGSVKFEQGSVATGHNVGRSIPESGAVPSSCFGQDDAAFDRFQAYLAISKRKGFVDLEFNLTSPKIISGSIEFTKGAPLNLVDDIAGQDFITFGLNLVATGYLKVDVSSPSAKCNDPIKFDGSLQYGSDTAPKLETVFVEGKNHTDITGGLTYNSTVDGGDGRSFIQYTEIESLTMRKCRGIRRVADETSLTDSWVTANTIKRLTLTACKEYSVDDAISGAEVSNNTVIYGVIQYGALESVFPTKGIEINAGVFNDYTIFVYDWNSTESPGPIVKFDNASADNRVKSSPLSWQKQDNGSRNRYESLQDSSVSNMWVSAWERSFLGHQDNILAHWSDKAGTLTGVASGGSGDRLVNVTNDTVNAVEVENEKFLGLTSTGTTGNAFYEIEFRSTTTFPLTSNMLMFKFDKGFEPSSAVIQVDTGSGYQNVASLIPQDDECFARFDVVGGTDIRTDIRGYKVILTFTDNREVRIRNIAANGTFMTCYPSRGGDFMGGDLVWKNGTGIVLTTPGGGEYRVQVDNAGNLITVANPAKKTTFLS